MKHLSKTLYIGVFRALNGEGICRKNISQNNYFREQKYFLRESYNWN